MEQGLQIGLIQPGKYQPRRFFAPDAMAELEASIRAVGVVQAITVRPIESGRYEIVAGERRWRGARAVYGDGGLIPALIRDMSDEEAERAALVENTERANMSPAEEAIAASKVLGRVKGDRDEAARVLGWTRQVLDKRLALNNCSDGVLQALTEQKIRLGHAELLAAVTKEKQEAIIGKLLAAPELPTVDALRGQLQAAARNLAVVTFDKTDCLNCTHNSAMQRSMFESAIEDGACTNPSCYDSKIEKHLDAQVSALKEEFPEVRIIRPGENLTVLALRADGDTGVGAEQAEACKGCANFGAAVSAIPNALGKVFRNQCFDPACNAQKVAARIKSERDAKTPANAKPDKGATTNGKTAKEVSKGTAATPKEPVTVAKVGQRVKDFRLKVWRKALDADLAAKPAENFCMLAALCGSHRSGKISSGHFTKAVEAVAGVKLSSGLADSASAVMNAISADQSVAGRIRIAMACAASDGLEERDVVESLKWLKTDLGKYWTVDAEFLDLLTKSEIEAVCGEIGVKAVFGDTWKSIASGKKDELIKRILKAEFDFAGKVPKVIDFNSNEKSIAFN